MNETYYSSEYHSGNANTRKKRKRRKSRFLRFLLLVIIAICVVAVVHIIRESPAKKVERLAEAEIPDWIDRQILPETCNSRRCVELEDINSIVIHYVGNPDTSAQNNRYYYENDDVDVNSHFLVGLEGEIIQCIPLNEKSSASNERNRDTISIEVCHPDETGEFNEDTYDALVRLTAWLCRVCGFDKEENIIRHYDVNGKLCPLYFVENEDAWAQFKMDVLSQID